MLGSTISKFFKIDSLIEHLTGYVETKVELVKVEVKRDLAEGLGKAITYFMLAFAFAMVLLFLSFGIALVLANLWGNIAGFGIVAAFYLIVGLIIFANRNKISKKFTNDISDTINKKKK